MSLFQNNIYKNAAQLTMIVCLPSGSLHPRKYHLSASRGRRERRPRLLRLRRRVHAHELWYRRRVDHRPRTHQLHTTNASAANCRHWDGWQQGVRDECTRHRIHRQCWGRRSAALHLCRSQEWDGGECSSGRGLDERR